jgi:hypothetical protein
MYKLVPAAYAGYNGIHFFPDQQLYFRLGLCFVQYERRRNNPRKSLTGYETLLRIFLTLLGEHEMAQCFPAPTNSAVFRAKLLEIKSFGPSFIESIRRATNGHHLTCPVGF